MAKAPTAIEQGMLPALQAVRMHAGQSWRAVGPMTHRAQPPPTPCLPSTCHEPHSERGGLAAAQAQREDKVCWVEVESERGGLYALRAAFEEAADAANMSSAQPQATAWPQGGMPRTQARVLCVAPPLRGMSRTQARVPCVAPPLRAPLHAGHAQAHPC